MASAQHQATWRAKVQKSRVEIYLAPEELARLDGLGGTRAEAIRGLLATDRSLRESQSCVPGLPADTLTELQASFPHQDGGIDWREVARAALITAHMRIGNMEQRFDEMKSAQITI